VLDQNIAGMLMDGKLLEKSGTEGALALLADATVRTSTVQVDMRT
jgi:hypothetical protein